MTKRMIFNLELRNKILKKAGGYPKMGIRDINLGIRKLLRTMERKSRTI